MLSKNQSESQTSTQGLKQSKAERSQVPWLSKRGKREDAKISGSPGARTSLPVLISLLVLISGTQCSEGTSGSAWALLVQRGHRQWHNPPERACSSGPRSRTWSHESLHPQQGCRDSALGMTWVGSPCVPPASPPQPEGHATRSAWLRVVWATAPAWWR